MGIGRILAGLGIPNAVKLDDFLFWGSSYSECLANVHCAIDLLQYWGFNINFRKSVIVPTQQIEYLRFLLNSSNVSFSVTKAKCVKSLPFISVLDRVKSLSACLFHKIIGFFNFVFELCPYFKLLLRIW